MQTGIVKMVKCNITTGPSLTLLIEYKAMTYVYRGVKGQINQNFDNSALAV